MRVEAAVHRVQGRVLVGNDAHGGAVLQHDLVWGGVFNGVAVREALEGAPAGGIGEARLGGVQAKLRNAGGVGLRLAYDGRRWNVWQRYVEFVLGGGDVVGLFRVY